MPVLPPPSFPACPSALQRQALLDLAQRARGGIPTHLLLWLLVGWVSGVMSRQPVLCAAVAALFFTNMVLRVALERRLPAWSSRRPVAARHVFLMLLLWNPLQWGVLAAAAFFWPPLQPAREGLWFVLTGVAASGGMSLAIDPLVRKTYAPLAVLPPLLAIPAVAEGSHLFASLSAVFFLLYVHRASGVVHADYWAAATARQELEARAQQLERLSCIDALTQVYNRQHFDRQLGLEWARAERDGLPLSLLMIDIDHFKRVNDTFGHPAGDACLKAVARALQEALFRPVDVLARYGGEEFVALMPSTDAPGAEVAAARLHQAVAGLRLQHQGCDVPLTCSIGLYTVPSAARGDAAAALSQADQALYRAKQQGRNRVVAAVAA